MTEIRPFSERLRRCADEISRRGPAALGSLYDLTAARVVRYAQALTRSAHDAEDVLQAVMVRIVLHPKKLAAADSPWAYFLRIVRNESIEIIQRKDRARLLRSLVRDNTPAPAAPEDGEFRQVVAAALERLPAAQSEVVVLKIWEELTFAEIGEVLGVSANTAASRYRYALEKLSQSLRPLRDEVWHE